MFWACVVLYVVLIAFRRIKHESAGDQRQEMQFQLAVLLTLIFMAPVWWQLLQFDAGNGHVWKAPKVLWFISYACCWLTLTVGIRGVFSEKALLSGGFLRGWLVALLALSLTIAGLFGLFFFGLDSQTLASIGGSVGAKFSGDSLYAISMASALFWSPLIAISLLLPARFIVFAFRSFGRSMTAKPQQDKAWTLLGAMMLIWLLSLLVVGVNEAIEAIESKASQSVPPGQATADTRIGPSGASTEAGIESQEAGAGRVDASSARVGGDGLRDAEVALYDKFPFLDRSSQRPYEEAILAVNKRAKELVFSGMGASEALLQAGRELGPRYASIRRAEKTVYQEYPFLDNLSPLADPAAILTVNKRAKQLVSDGMAPDDALLKAGREVGSANNENRRR